jgi:hypothetical protein
MVVNGHYNFKTQFSRSLDINMSGFYQQLKFDLIILFPLTNISRLNLVLQKMSQTFSYRNIPGICNIDRKKE